MDPKIQEKASEHPIETTDSSRSSSVIDNRDIEHEPTTVNNKQAISVHSTAPSISQLRVPRNQRRGFLARLSVIPEITEPTYYARQTKWTITAVVAVAAAAAPTGSATIMPALTQVSEYFHTSDTITNLSMALYMLSMSIFPLWWSSFSETLGRRTIYIVSFAMYTVFAVLASVSTNITMLIVMRVLAGGSAASVQAVGAGTIADIWEPRERGRAMGIFYIGPLCGPLFAPIIGGALAHRFGWRATQWFLVIFGVVVTIGLIFCLPETLKNRKQDLPDVSVPEKGLGVTEMKIPGSNQTEPMTLQRSATTTRSVKKSTRNMAKFLKVAFIDPLKIILLLRFPAVAITVFYASITFGSLYFLNISIETAFSHSPYNFSTLIVGLMYLPGSVGYFLASVLGGPWLDHIMKREARKKGRMDENGKYILRPEDRMKENAWLACFMFPAGLIAYGWSVENGVFFVYPVSINSYVVIESLLIIPAYCIVLLRLRVDDHLCDVYDHVDGVYASKSINWHCSQ